jgi:hypothetical protein
MIKAPPNSGVSLTRDCERVLEPWMISVSGTTLFNLSYSSVLLKYSVIIKHRKGDRDHPR